MGDGIAGHAPGTNDDPPAATLVETNAPRLKNTNAQPSAIRGMRLI